MPRSKAKSLGCVYCRYSSRFQDSIGDQLRKVLEEACELGIFIAREHIFFDTAVRELFLAFFFCRRGVTASPSPAAR